MKTKFVPALIMAAAFTAATAQDSGVALPTAQTNGRGGSISESQRDDQLRKAKDELAELKLKYTDLHPNVLAAKKRVEELETASNQGGGGVAVGIPSGAHFGQRLQSIVRRADAGGTPGSVILTSPTPQKDVDEMCEDLSVLNFIFNRNLERTFGDKATEYRLGVPMTMRDSRPVETSYIQDFGVLVKVRVPFPVISIGDHEKKIDKNKNAADTEWEKARRALYGGDADPTATSATPLVYDERLVNELKKQMFEALKNAANIRHMEPNQSITVAVIGGANASSVPQFGGGNIDPNLTRSTVLTIRVSKAQADEAAKNSGGSDDLAKQATIVAYFDTEPASARTNPFGTTGIFGGGSSFGGGYGGGGYGGSGFNYPLSQPAAR